MKERIARSVFWIGWSRGVLQGVSLLTTVLVARMLNPADYGLMALVTIWTGTLAIVAELGLGAAVIQFPDLDNSELNLCFWLAAGAATAAYAVLYVAAAPIAEWFSSAKLVNLLRVSGLVLPLSAIRLIPEGLLRKRLELDRVSQAEVAGALVSLPVIVVLAWQGAGVWALVAGTLILPLVQMAVVYQSSPWRPGLRARTGRLRALLRYGLGSLGARASWAAFEQVDTFVLGRTVGHIGLGFFSVAKSLATLPVVKISVLVNQLAFPVMAGAQADQSIQRASFLRSLRFVACLTIPAAVGLALVAGDLIALALGTKWLPTIPVLRVLALFGLVHSLGVLFPPVLFARYRPASVFWWTVGLLVIMPFGFWAGARLWGSIGVALAWVTLYPVLMLWMVQRALRELGVTWRAVWTELRPIAGAALLMSAGVLVVYWALPGSALPQQVGRLIAAVTVGAILYCLAIFWRGRELAAEVMEVAAWLFRRPGRIARVHVRIP